MRPNKQKLIVIGSMTVLLVAAAVLNYKLSHNDAAKNASAARSTAAPMTTAAPGEDSVNTAAQTVKFFSDYKTDRDEKRADEATYLDSVLNDTKTDAPTRAEAQKMKLELTKTLEKELAIESLLKAKGFENVAAIFHTGSVNVVVGNPKLSETEVAQILAVVQQESGESAENIKIIPVP